MPRRSRSTIKRKRSEYNYLTDFGSKSTFPIKESLDCADVKRGLALAIFNSTQFHHQSRSKNPKLAYPKPVLFHNPEHFTPPSFEEILTLIEKIFDKRRLPLEAGIVALILLHRTRISITSYNWERLILISLLLANKQIEDVYSVWNSKFLEIIPNLTNLEINVLELEYLQILKYQLYIDECSYKTMYEKVRSVTPEDTIERTTECSAP